MANFAVNVADGGGGKTETFNENNVQNDFKAIREAAEKVERALQSGNKHIDDAIGNSETTDAYSGAAGSSIAQQWNDLASTFRAFMNNFNSWSDQAIETTKLNINLQNETKDVKIEEQ